MSEHLEGGCLCGQIRYRYEAKPDFSIHCHCRRCQHITGAGHSSAFVALREHLSLSGDLAEYSSGSDAGHKVTSSFCPTCGSPIHSQTERFDDRVYIHAGSMDDPSSFQADLVVFESEGHPWDCQDPDLPRPE